MKRVLILAALAMPTPAAADQLDGVWCRPASRDRMVIDGLHVITPEGAEVTARRTHHGLEYDVPAGERPNGGRITADLLDADRLNVSYVKQRQHEPPAHDHWTRCDRVS